MSSELSEEENDLQTPRLLRKSSRYSLRSSTQGTPPSAVSSVVLGPISEEVLRIWSQLPECIRLDPSLGAIQREYERLTVHTEKTQLLSGTMGAEETVVLNMSITTHQSPSVKMKNGVQAADEGDHIDPRVHGHRYYKKRPVFRYSKLVLLVCYWIIFTIILMTTDGKTPIMRHTFVPKGQIQSYPLEEHSTSNRLGITLQGPFLPRFEKHSKKNVSLAHLLVWVVSTSARAINDNSSRDSLCSMNATEPWIVPILPEDTIDLLPANREKKIFDLTNPTGECENNDLDRTIVVNIMSNLSANLSISIAHDFSPIKLSDSIAYASVVLLFLYVLIIFEIVHRALAAMLASTMSIAILTALDERPTMSELISWIDVDTLLLLFSMMILVAMFAETGVFDYLAVCAFKITGGKLWPLISTLCFFTALISCVLDNVTTVLLMTPVTIRLCEVKELNPVPILTAMVVFSNIGGAATPVGDPPNVIIASNRDVIDAGVGFGTFVAHMGIGVSIVLAVVYAQLRFLFRDVSVLGFDEPQEVQELRHEILIWQRAAASLSSYSKEENLVRLTLLKKIQRLLSLLKKKLMTGSVALEKYKTTLEELQEKYPIRDKWLLAKSSLALVFVITFFFLHNLPSLHLSLGWTALLGVLLLLVLADSQDIDGILARVEWGTLLFFASLFILMEALERLGLIAWIGKLTENVILSVNEESRLAVAILLILWVSALASAFVDNVPLATMMVRISTSLSQNEELRLPLQPLIWALAFGACMGGNATLIGATANVVCAGVAEQHGYRFTFVQFFKFGFPIMLTSTATITVYLMIAHVVFDWN